MFREEIVQDETDNLRNENFKSTGSNDDLILEHTQIILGEKLKNPYSVSSMQAAFDYYNEVVDKSPFKDKVVKATHKYIRIKADSEAHLKFMDSLDMGLGKDDPIFHDYPLDYEIIQEGHYYVKPQDENDLYHDIYTVIPIDYVFGEELPYEVLEDLYHPTDEEYDVETVALVFADWQEDLKADFDKEIYVENLPDLLNQWRQEDLSQAKFFGRRRFKPQGWIKVENTDSGSDDPLMNAQLHIGRSFWWKDSSTDMYSGFYRASKSYRGRVRVRAKWRGYTVSIRKSWNEVLGIQVSDHIKTVTRRRNNRSRTIPYSQSHEWVKGTVHNGIMKYNLYCNQNGIDKPIRRSIVWAWANGGASSTPMMYEFRNLPLITSFSNVGQANVWQNITAFGGGMVLGITPAWLRPDVLYQGLTRSKMFSGGNQANTVRIHQLVFHKSGHYSHALKAGKWMWSQNVAATIGNEIANHGSYGNGAQPSFTAGNRIAMVEGWGTLTEFKITSFYYGKAWTQSATTSTFSNTANLEDFMEDFDMYQRPMSINRWDDRGWFMHGLMWDLIDNRNEIPLSAGRPFVESELLSGDGTTVINYIEDHVNLSGSDNFDLSPIFNVLQNQTEDACDLYYRLVANYPGEMEELWLLFSRYGFVCGSLPANPAP